jgi:small-conductance mechanosensitive channel
VKEDIMRDRLMPVLERYWEGFWILLPKIVLAVGVLILAVIIAKRVKKIVQKRTSKRLDDPLLARFIAKVFQWSIIVLGLAIAMHLVELGGIARGLLTSAGITGIVLGFAFRDIGENLLSGVLLAFSRPFNVGDTIQSESITGVVKTLDLRNTHIRSFDGKDIYIPNAIIVKNPLFNYTRDGLLRFDFVVGIDQGDDAIQAKDLILKGIENVDGVLKEPAPIVSVEELAKSTVNLRVYYWVNLFDYKGSALELKTNIINHTKEILMDRGFSLPADIHELKIYKEESPIPLRILSDLPSE